MAKHEFGIMLVAPKTGARYDSYEPEKYSCISVDDDLIEKIAPKLLCVPMYWHTVDRKEKGLAYCGITLIPPSSAEKIVCALGNLQGFESLKSLLIDAKLQNKFVIHFGI